MDKINSWVGANKNYLIGAGILVLLALGWYLFRSVPSNSGGIAGITGQLDSVSQSQSAATQQLDAIGGGLVQSQTTVDAIAGSVANAQNTVDSLTAGNSDSQVRATDSAGRIKRCQQIVSSIWQRGEVGTQ